jgi:hypothetical protein
MTQKKQKKNRVIKEIEDLSLDDKIESENRAKLFIKPPFKLTEKQIELIKLIQNENVNIIFVEGCAGTAKAQPLDAKILTPLGYKDMGKIKVGDMVIAKNGSPTKVNGVFPQGEKEIFVVRFSDKTSTECTEDHLWFTQTDKERNHHRKIPGNWHFTEKYPLSGKVRTLKEIKESLTIRNGKRINHSIPMCEPIRFEEKKHFISPYLMGILLGDGGLTISVGITSADNEIVERIENEAISHGHRLNKRDQYGFAICKNTQDNIIERNQYLDEIRRLGLFGKKSHEKFIPDEYLVDSIDNRLELLRGLMDSDGTTDGHYTSYTTTSLLLSNDVKKLIQSFGGTYVVTEKKPSFYYKGKKKVGKNAYIGTVNLPNRINPFWLKRKREKYVQKTKYIPIRYITEIKSLGVKNCQCLLVDDPEHLYLTNDCIVTHNTTTSVLGSLQLLNDNQSIEQILYIRSITESADKSIGALPGNFKEKTAPFAAPLIDKLEQLVSPKDVKELISSKQIEFAPINFLRGADWKNKIVILDEAQGLSIREFETVLTRLGANSKLIICGDARQSDIGRKSGFKKIMEHFSSCVESKKWGIESFQFTPEDILRSPFLKFVIEEMDKIKSQI